MSDKLYRKRTIAECEEKARIFGAERHELYEELFTLLADIMRENERLLNFKKCFGIANDSDGSKIVQISARAKVLESYKDAENVG